MSFQQVKFHLILTCLSLLGLIGVTLVKLKPELSQYLPSVEGLQGSDNLGEVKWSVWLNEATIS